ncbi:MAG TPA: hypothetical protein VMI54_00635 [Polyangiaceae bacterium]|nr:hypothetical protein [Polyangiaceae bacterium]
MLRGMARTRGLELFAAAAALVACNDILGIKKYEARPATGAESGGTSSGATSSGGSSDTETGGSSGTETGGTGDVTGEAGGGAQPSSGGTQGGSTASGGKGGSGTSATGGRGGGSHGGSTSSGGTSGGGTTTGGASGEAGETNGGAGAGNTCSGSVCGTACVDEQTDPHDCGACGHDCAGGQCSGGRCQSVQLTTGKGRLFMVEVVNGYVYYGGDGVDVRRMSIDGTGDTAIAPSSSSDHEYVYDWAVTPDAILWGNDSLPNGVRGCALPACAGGPQVYENTSQFVHALAYASADNLVFFDDGANLEQAAAPGGVASDFATAQDPLVEATADATTVYWATDSGDTNGVNIHARAVVGGTTKNLVSNLNVEPFGLSASPSFLFFTLSGTGSVYSTPLPDGSGAGAPTLVGTAGVNARKVFTVDGLVYWAAAGDTPNATGSIVRCPETGCNGGTPDAVATTTAGPWGLTVADGVLYWVTESGEVGKVAL